MTFCKELASKETSRGTATAWELWDKYDSAPRYEITISLDSIAYEVIKTAKTTWRRALKSL